MKSPEGEFFRRFAEQGHYGGRNRPSGTRQGIYAVAPSGAFLASINTTDAQAMMEMLRKALVKWRELPREDRYLEEDPAEVSGLKRLEDQYPEDGLVLRTVTRDLPRERVGKDWRGKAWNMDYAWFRKSDVTGFLPAESRAGETFAVAEGLVKHLLQLHLVDNVRGQTLPLGAKTVDAAELAGRVTSVEGSRISIDYEGKVRVEVKGRWSVDGYNDMNDPSEQKRGFEGKLRGHAVYDREKERFTEFELIAAGTRWGGTQYNFRADDLDPAPMGVLFTLAGDTPAERVAPGLFWAYGW